MTKATITSVLGKRLGYWVAKKRAKARLTQKELADKAEMKDVAKVREIERGMRSTSYGMVESLARVFGVDPAKMFEKPKGEDWNDE